MRRVDLELLVQKAVEARRAGKPLEDDRVEFKSDWPKPEKARQMAGAANSLRGEPLVYVVGVDNDGAVQQITDLEPGDWYLGFVKGFDSPPPRLVFNVNVAVGDAPEDSVVALLFETDEFPYVMNVQGVSDRREVPVRVGGATHSANRRQLMRILAPVVASPPTEVVELTASGRLQDGPEVPEQTLQDRRIAGRPAHRDVAIDVEGSVFIEHVAPRPVSIPERSLRCALFIGDLRVDLDEKLHVNQLTPLSFSGRDRPPERIPPSFGVYARDGSIVATGPGEFRFRARVQWSYEVGSPQFDEMVGLLLNQQEMHLDLTFKFVAADSPVTLRPVLHCTTPGIEPPEFDGAGYRMWNLGQWSLDDA